MSRSLTQTKHTPVHHHPSFAQVHITLTSHKPRSPEVVIKPLKGIPNKRQAHLRALLLLPGRAAGAVPSLGGLEVRGIVRLVDLVGGEVGRVDVGRQARLKRRADPPQAVELDAPEEGVVLELVRAAAADAVFGVADQTRDKNGK